jgi:hypothetical protein
MKYSSPLKLTIYGDKSAGCIVMAAVRETAEKFGKENTQQIGCIGDAQGHEGDNRSERFWSKETKMIRNPLEKSGVWRTGSREDQIWREGRECAQKKMPTLSARRPASEPRS